MNSRDLDYRGKEFALACSHLISGRFNISEKIDLVCAIYDKARRTFREKRDYLFNKI